MVQGNLPPLTSRRFAVLCVTSLCLAFLSACETSPRQIEASEPRVSYAYGDGEAEEVKQRAAKYCYENYDRSARVIADKVEGDDRVMTFECVRLN